MNMRPLDRASKNERLGRDFLLWLWFRSEMDECRFDLDEGGPVEIWVDRRMVLKADRGGRMEKLTCTGENYHFREARMALKDGKDLTEILVKLRMGDHEWQFVMDSTWLNFKSMRTPKVVLDKNEDPDGIFYEKIYLIEQGVGVMDTLFARFIKLRLSPDWKEEELPLLKEWLEKG